MASFSQGFLNNLGRPAMTQSLFDLGSAIGQAPSQYRAKQKRDALKSHDPSTYDGQIALLSAQIQQETDPNVRAELGRQLIAMKQSQTDRSRSEAEYAQSQQAIEASKVLAAKLEAAGDPETAQLLRSGAIKAPTAMTALKRISTVASGVAGRRQLVKSLGLEREGTFSEEDYSLSDTQFNTKVKKAEETKERKALAAQLNKNGETELAEMVEQGIYTRGDVSQVLRSRKGEGGATKYNNRSQKVVDGKVVWVADVTPPNGDEFVAYMKDGKWVPVEAGDVKDLPEKVKKSVSSVTKVDQDNAAVYLADNESYLDLTPTGKAQAQLAFASIAKRLVDEKKAKSMEEAMKMASETIDLSKFEDGRNWFEVLYDDVFTVSEGAPKTQADDYINQARKKN
jgi:hypothetical protein